jgi:hypothetical protein
VLLHHPQELLKSVGLGKVVPDPESNTPIGCSAFIPSSPFYAFSKTTAKTELPELIANCFYYNAIVHDFATLEGFRVAKS